MRPLIARAIAFVGVILSIASIWTHVSSYGGSYWQSPHHALGITVLVLAIVAGIGVLLAVLLNGPVFDRLWVLAGMTVGGLLFFIPIDFAGSGSLGQMRAGGWLGAASLLLFLLAGALLPLSIASQPDRSVAQPVAAAAPAGWFPDPTGQTRLRYWDGAVWTETTSA